MASGQFVAYYRVSTKRQGHSGLGLDAQREAVENYLNGGAWQLVGEFIEVESGRKDKRPKLAEALRLCRLRNATLVVAKMDRLSRNVHFLTGVKASGVNVVAADFPEANSMMINILATVAEYEGDMIRARTKAALQAAKARGKVLGGDRGNLPAVAKAGAAASVAARRKKAADRLQDLTPVIEDIREGGASSLREIAGELNRRGIPTARGGTWSAVQVRRVIAPGAPASTAAPIGAAG